MAKKEYERKCISVDKAIFWFLYNGCKQNGVELLKQKIVTMEEIESFCIKYNEKILESNNNENKKIYNTSQ